MMLALKKVVLTVTGRIRSNGTNWPTSGLITSDDLQLYEGAIVYPNKDFRNINFMPNEDAYNFSDDTGDKVYYVKLPFSRSTQQPKLTIKGRNLNTNLKSVCVANSLDATVLDNRDALKTVANGGVNDGYVTNSANEKVINLSYLGVGETINTAGAYAKIVMSGVGAEITQISLA